MNQRGFATLEIIMVVVIIGILATIAVPNFSNVTEKANTAKIQSDLTTIDSAIQMYYMEKGEYPSTIADLVNNAYLMDTPTPPKGKAFVNGTSTEISGNYDVKDKTIGTGTSAKTIRRAVLGENVAGDFSLTAKTTSSTSGGG